MVYGLVALLVVAAVALVLAGVAVDGAIIGTDALISLAWVALQAKRRA